jgi:thiol-disulfide isomerase/thioredoxin
MRTFVLSCTVAILLTGCAAFNQGQYDGIERGWIERSAFEKPSLSEFKINYDTATVAPEMVSMLSQVRDSVDALVFLGTWCPDSKHQVPHFLKIADLCGIPASRVRLYGLDRSKKDADGLAEQYSISRIPTFIFFKGGKEIGRIVEFPQTTIEADMLAIFVAAQKSIGNS